MPRKNAAVSTAPGRPGALFAAGVAELNARRFLRARRILARAAVAGGRDAAWACQELVQTFLRRGDVEGAEPALRELLPAGSSLLLHALGYLDRRRGRTGPARRRQDQVVRRRPLLWAARIELARLDLLDRREAAALAMFRRGERHFGAIGDRWGVAACVTAQAVAALHGYRLGEALRLNARSRREKARCGDLFNLCGETHNAGLLQFWLARYGEALDLLDEALRMARRVGTRTGEMYCHNEIGLCYLDLAEPALAAREFRAALGILRRTGDAVGEGICLGNLALTSRMRGRLGEAIRRNRAALDRFPRQGAADAVGLTAAHLAQTLTLAGRAPEALAALRRMARRAAGATEPRTEIMLERERARAALASGRVRLGLAASSRALAIGARIPGPQASLIVELTEARVLRGQALIAAGDRRRGERVLRRAVDAIEAVLGGQAGAALRIGLRETMRDVHDALIRSLLDPVRPRVRRAWEVATRLKARELHAVLSGRAGVGPTRGEDEVAAEIRRLAIVPRLAPPELRRLRALRRRFVALHRRAAAVRPGASGGGRARSGAWIEPGGALLEYHVMRDTTLVFTVHGRRLRHVDLALPERTLARALDRLLAPLLTASRHPNPRQRLESFDVALAERLFRRLLAPALQGLPADTTRLTIVADGPLHTLPFELLVERPPEPSPTPASAGARPDYLTARYAGDRFTVRYLPSALLLDRREHLRRRRRTPVVLAFSPGAGAAIHAHRGRVAIAPLPGALAEARLVAASLGGARVRTGAEASVAAYRRAAPAAGIVHIAAHALADPEAPSLSGIVLAAGRGRRSIDLLTAAELARIRLRGPLVTLSACDTGRGRRRGREGVLGLARALFEAGAAAVVASLWPVDDRTTATLMAAFYRALASGMERGEALAAAKRSLRREQPPASPRAHPFFWAAFVLLDRQATAGGKTSRPSTRSRRPATATPSVSRR